MNNIILLSVLAMFLIGFTQSCKKDDTDSNTGPADNYVGNWLALDTVYKTDGSYIQSGQINFSVIKKDANSVNLTGFMLNDTVLFYATPTNLTYKSNGGTYEYWYQTLALTLNGDKIYYTNAVNGGNVIKGTATRK